MSNRSSVRLEDGQKELRGVLLQPVVFYRQAVWMSLVIGVLVLAPSAFMFEVYGRVLNSRSFETLGWLLLAALGVYAVLELLELARLRVLQRAGQMVRDRLTERVFDASFEVRLRRLPVGAAQAPGDLRALSDFVHSPIVTGLMDLPAAALCLVLLFVMSPWLGALAMGLLLLQVMVGVFQERTASRPYGEANRAASESQTRAAGILRNAQVIASMGMGADLHRLWRRSQLRFMISLGQASERAGMANAATKFLGVTQGSMILGLAVWLALFDQLLGGPGMAIVASILAGRVLAPVTQIMGQWRAIGAASSAHARLVELLSLAAVAKPGLELPAPKGQLMVENLVAVAPGSQFPILRGVSMGCRAGEMLVVVGPSAAGKSSLARLLVGVWPAESGKVRLDGADVYQWHKSQLGAHIGYLPQEVQLFDGSLAENIARFGEPDMAKLDRAVQVSGIGQLIDSLPNGLQTRIGEEGVMLSGGQRQRVGLARAIYGDPQLIVLDEPSSSLDEAGDQALLKLLAAQKERGATVVVITHRAHVLELATYVLLLNEGATAKFGPRDEVLAAMRESGERHAAKPVRSAPQIQQTVAQDNAPKP
jgi:ATP-binding cassette subfamily C exporter for protease/lipase